VSTTKVTLILMWDDVITLHLEGQWMKK